MSLKKGDTGTAVADLQRRLTTAGYPVAVDGWFGEATEQALVAFQAGLHDRRHRSGGPAHPGRPARQ